MADADLLIVDDHPLFSGGFVDMARALRPAWTLRCAANAAQTIAALQAGLPDAAIVDISLPGEDGFALIKAIHAAWPQLPVLLMSGREDAAVRVRARAAGAAGFVAKNSSPAIFVAVIESVLQGGQCFEPNPAMGSPPGDMPVITKRQAEVLALLAEGHANKEIRYRLGIAERTVRAHLTELFQLLGANSRMQAVIRGRELGLIE
jgi:DNA-binding NarL/FixJ family response regulator